MRSDCNQRLHVSESGGCLVCLYNFGIVDIQGVLGIQCLEIKKLFLVYILYIYCVNEVLYF